MHADAAACLTAAGMGPFDQSDIDRIGMKGIQRNRHKYKRELRNFHLPSPAQHKPQQMFWEVTDDEDKRSFLFWTVAPCIVAGQCRFARRRRAVGWIVDAGFRS